MDFLVREDFAHETSRIVVCDCKHKKSESCNYVSVSNVELIKIIKSLTRKGKRDSFEAEGNEVR